VSILCCHAAEANDGVESTDDPTPLMRTSVTEQVLAHNFIYIQTSFTFRILVNLTVGFHIPYYKSI